MGFCRFVPFMIVISLVFCLSCASDEEKIQTYLNSGDSYFAQEEYRSAEIEFKNAIQIDPNLVEAHLKLGETYLKLGNARGAFSEFSTAAKIAPDNLDTQLKLATFLFLGKQMDLKMSRRCCCKRDWMSARSNLKRRWQLTKRCSRSTAAGSGRIWVWHGSNSVWVAGMWPKPH